MALQAIGHGHWHENVVDPLTRRVTVPAANSERIVAVPRGNALAIGRRPCCSKDVQISGRDDAAIVSRADGRAAIEIAEQDSRKRLRDRKGVRDGLSRPAAADTMDGSPGRDGDPAQRRPQLRRDAGLT
jgi:hypothetical protein